MNYSKSALVAFIIVVVLNVEYMYAPPPPVGFPIDGGISYLILSGVIYGIYETFRRR